MMNSRLMLATALLALMGSCITKPEEAPHPDEARIRAEIAAKAVIDHANANELTLQGYLLDAKAEQSRFVEMGDTAATEAFRVSFESYIRQHNDSLAKALF